MSVEACSIAKFRLGQLVSTQNVMSQLTQEDILMTIRRHQAGDWGDVTENSQQANERALIEHTRLLAVYHAASGIKFWLITEADRSVTTVLLPEDY
jgi:hypothetical protein